MPQMSWEIDVPKLPFKKPSQIEQLEAMRPEQREAMDSSEIEERINAAADSLVWTYVREMREEAHFDMCVAIVSHALSEMGAALGGKVGAILVGTSERAARRASRE